MLGTRCPIIEGDIGLKPVIAPSPQHFELKSMNPVQKSKWSVLLNLLEEQKRKLAFTKVPNALGDIFLKFSLHELLKNKFSMNTLKRRSALTLWI